MIDIHSHILPGVDDGARSLEEALIMAEMAAKSGVRVITATPHANQPDGFENYDSEELTNIYMKLKEAIAEEGIPIQLVRGMEVFGTIDVSKAIREKRVRSLNGTRYVLVEFAFNSAPESIEARLRSVLRRGMVPVIAHPERYYCVQDDPNYLYKWRTLGALAQLNKASVFGRFGSMTKKTAKLILDHHMVNCVASDAHGIQSRTTDMREIKEYLEKNYSERMAMRLLRTNPENILMNRQVIKTGEMSTIV